MLIHFAFCVIIRYYISAIYLGVI